jgi:uncharacterized protein YcbX
MRDMRLTSLHIYPLKGCRAIDLDTAAVEPWGLAGDRRWLAVNSEGRFISQREHASLARLIVTYGPGEGITVSSEVRGETGGLAPPCEKLAPLFIATPGAGGMSGGRAPEPELLKVTVWGSTVLAAAAGAAADAWFSAFLGEPARVVYLDDPTRRAVDQEFGAAGDVVSFADGYPLLLTNTGSLAELRSWLTDAGHAPVPMNRFRPNAVVSGFEPWAEDRWHRVRIGAVTFRVAKPCGRCVVTTTDQFTGVRGKQPLAMLGKRRRFGSSLVFGQNVIPDSPGEIRVGDAVEVLGLARFAWAAGWNHGTVPHRHDVDFSRRWSASQSAILERDS